MTTLDLLPVYAAPVEGDALQHLGARPLGVGKIAAALAMQELLRAARPAAVLLFGVAGAYPPEHRRGCRLSVLDLCLVGDDWLGDEGVDTPGGFRDLAQLGLGSNGPFASDPARTAAAAALLRIPVVRGVTVSSCSGTDARSAALAARSDADVETMEGAAVAIACARSGVPLLHLRAISNWTGDRAHGAWDLHGAVQRLQPAVARLLGGGLGSAW